MQPINFRASAVFFVAIMMSIAITSIGVRTDIVDSREKVLVAVKESEARAQARSWATKIHAGETDDAIHCFANTPDGEMGYIRELDPWGEEMRYSIGVENKWARRYVEVRSYGPDRQTVGDYSKDDVVVRKLWWNAEQK